MLADAYKIASDINQAMSILNTSDLEYFKSELKILGSLKQTLISIGHRFDNSMPKYLCMFAKSRKYESIMCIISANDCLPDMIRHIDLMIDNADAYYYSIYHDIVRDLPKVGESLAEYDIDQIMEVSIECIDAIAAGRPISCQI